MSSESTIQFLLERNRPEDAERAAREALSKDPEDLGLMVFLTAALLDQSKPKAAEKVARDMIAQDPDSDLRPLPCRRVPNRHPRVLRTPLQ